MFKKIFLLMLLTSFIGISEAQDCAPATLCRIFPKVPYTAMCKACGTSKDGSLMSESLLAYKKFSTNELRCIFSVNTNDIPYDENFVIDHNDVYLWIGICQRGEHCALVKLQEHDVLMSNSQFWPNSTNYFVLKYTYPRFFQDTHYIFASKDLNNKIRFQ